mgnify:FL=1
MTCSYSESVLNHASDGYLNASDVKQLLNEHGFTVTDWCQDVERRGWSSDVLDHAPTLLTWLGY